MTFEQDIKEQARRLGFDAVGITDASPIAQADVDRLTTWLDSGAAGQMHYLYRHFDKRIAPAALLDGAQSVIVVALNYKPAERVPPSTATSGPTGAVAQYAWYEDYHEFIRPKLYELADFIRTRTDDTPRFKACVDSVPLAERALAVRAGLGFIGKNHMLIHPTLGPQIFLGELVTTVALRPDDPVAGTCAGCDRCLAACPTGALRRDGRFDANRCISYLTIEHREAIASEWTAKMGDRLFGCDACVLACPYRRAAPACTNHQIRFFPERTHLNLAHILGLSEESFAAEFAGSPIARPGLAGLKRNARICLANFRRQETGG